MCSRVQLLWGSKQQTVPSCGPLGLEESIKNIFAHVMMEQTHSERLVLLQVIFDSKRLPAKGFPSFCGLLKGDDNSLDQ